MVPVLIGLAVCAAVILLGAAIRDSNRFLTLHYGVPCKKITREYHFVMLSDLHNKQFGENNRRLLEAIEEIRPESILIAGDMVTSQVSGSSRPALELVKELAKHYPVYYADGNHEYRMKTERKRYGSRYEEYRRALEKQGVIFLENSSVLLPDARIRIHGLDLDLEYYKKFGKKPMESGCMQSFLGIPSEEEYHILLAHNPDYFPEYADWGADLVLAGHVHGGIMRLPVLGGVLSPSLRLFPKYDGGEYTEGNSRMILGRGLGSHTIPVRIFNPGELIEVRLIPDGGN